MPKRNGDIDFLKGLFILLMVAFHLVYIGDLYPYVKRVVYTFHMPGFLLLSGYLTRFDREPRRFLRGVCWLFVPYAVMESGYVVMSALLPVREAVDELSLTLLMQKLFLHPLGPYWYLHTLICCQLALYIATRLFPRNTALFLLSGLALLGTLAFLLHLLSWSCAGYFLLGALLSRLAGRGAATAESRSIATADKGGIAVTTEKYFSPFVRRPLTVRALLPVSGWSLIPLMVLLLFPANLHQDTPGGFLIVWLMFGTLLALGKRLSPFLRHGVECTGMHTLPIFLFSPLFTLVFKGVVPLFSFDPTGILYLIVALTGTVYGSWAIALLMDRLRLTPLFIGRERFL